MKMLMLSTHTFRTIILCCACCVAIGCSRWRVHKEIEMFTKTAIRIPDDMDVIQNGLLDSCVRPLPYKIKLIVYYTSKGCSSCNIGHLGDLEEFFNLKHGDSYSPVVIFAPEAQKYHELVHSLKLQAYPFPIYIDKNGSFERLNTNLPADTRYHTFLVDKNDYITLVGNPIWNEAIRILFFSTLDNMLSHDGVYVPEK